MIFLGGVVIAWAAYKRDQKKSLDPQDGEVEGPSGFLRQTMPPPLSNDSIAMTSVTNPSTVAKTILITGCSSGIGLAAAKILHGSGVGHRILLVARTKKKAEIAKKEILASAHETCELVNTNGSLIIPMACDMSSFDSIKSFASELSEMMEQEEIQSSRWSNGIDVVCLNAGMCAQRNSKPAFTEDGLELTIATNYFGPFLLINRISGLIRKGGRVVVTASGVHNSTRIRPKKPTFNDFRGMFEEDGKTIKKSFETMNGSEFDHYRVYTFSKLCNVAFCIELNRLLEKKGIVANSFCPGLVTETGLFRNNSRLKRAAFGVVMDNMAKVGDTLEWAGGALAYMATDVEVGKSGGKYYKAPNGISRKGGEYSKDFLPQEVSEEAADPNNQRKLWELSLQILEESGQSHAGIP